MATCRDVIGDALRALGATAPGADPTADELAAGMTAISELILDLHEARGPMIDVDVTGDYVAGEDQRLRIQAGITVSITMPNALPLYWTWDPFDYGFSAPLPLLPVQGLSTSADGIASRQPRDGARVEIVGTAQALYFYRADLNAWVVASPLTVDGPVPLNARYAGALAALTAERLQDAMGLPASPSLVKRIIRGNSALMLRSGTARDPLMVQYF